MPILVHFRSLIPEMSMFILAICCLTTSNMSWLMDLTFQFPMQYCSLRHQTLLSSPITYPSGCCFYLGSISSFFLGLFLHSSPVAYWAPTNLGSSSFNVIPFCLFILFMGFLWQGYWSDLTNQWICNLNTLRNWAKYCNELSPEPKVGRSGFEFWL